MAVDEAARHQLYTRLAETLGDQPTSTLMSLLPPVGWADVATKEDLHALESTLRGEMAELRAEFTRLRGDVATEIAGLESRLTTALRQQLFALLGAMVMVSGLTVGATAALV